MKNYILLDVLMEYVIEGKIEKVIELVSTVPDINKICYNGYSMLHHAASNGHIKIVEYLVSRGHKINWRDESLGSTPVHGAVRSGHPKILKMLMINGGEINVKDSHGKEPLHYAAESGNVEIVDLLLSKGHSKIIAMLLRSGANVTSQDHFGKTALHYAAQYGHLECTDLLLSNKYNNLGKVLISKGIEVDIQDENGYTPFFYSIIGGYINLANLLVSKGVNINIRNKDGDTPIMAACRIGNMLVFDFLIQLGATISELNHKGNNTFMIASKSGHDLIVKKLLSQNFDINITNLDGKNALILAVENNNTETSRCLIDAGIDLNRRDIFGDTAVLISVRHGNVSIFKMLLEMNVDLSITNLKNENVFYAASIYGNNEIFDLVISSLRNFNPKSDVCKLALMNAVKNGHSYIVKTLAEKGVNLDIRDNLGDTLLHISSAQGYESIVKYLTDQNLDVNARNLNGETPLHKAAEYGRSTKIVLYLVDKGADLEAENKAGRNPLNIATKKSQFNVFEILLKNNPENISLRKAMLKASSKLPPNLAKILTNSRKLINKYRSSPMQSKLFNSDSSARSNVSDILRSITSSELLDNIPAEILEKFNNLNTIVDYRLMLALHFIALKVIEKTSDDELFEYMKQISISNEGINDVNLLRAIFYTNDVIYPKTIFFDVNENEYFTSIKEIQQYTSIVEKFDNYVAPFIENALVSNQGDNVFSYSPIIERRISKLKGLRDMQLNERLEKYKMYEQRYNKLLSSDQFSHLYKLKDALYRYKHIKNLLKENKTANTNATKLNKIVLSKDNKSMDVSETNTNKIILSKDNLSGEIPDEKLLREVLFLEQKYVAIGKVDYNSLINKYEDVLDKIDFCRTCINYCIFLYSKN